MQSKLGSGSSRSIAQCSGNRPVTEKQIQEKHINQKNHLMIVHFLLPRKCTHSARKIKIWTVLLYLAHFLECGLPPDMLVLWLVLLLYFVETPQLDAALFYSD